MSESRTGWARKLQESELSSSDTGPPGELELSTMTQSTRKSNQRSRILRAMTEIVARQGYAQASIAQAVSLARVSRSTFYEHFEDKLDCFLALERELGGQAIASIEQVALESNPENVAQVTIQALVELVERDPIGARVLLSESLAAGARAMDERDAFMGRIEALIEELWTAAPTGAPSLDLPAQVLVGGVCRLLSIRIQRGAGGMQGVLPDLLTWADSYTRGDGQPRWRMLGRKDWTPLAPSAHADVPMAPAPARLPAGRHSLPVAYVSANQRERILHATVTMLMKKGYTATTVADIVAEAQLTRAVFYQNFRDKEELLSEINQVHFQQMMAVSASAFFSEEHWPERAWAAIHAAGEVNAAHPAGAHIGFIDTNAVGPELTRRVNDIIMAFGIFLEEGYRVRPEAESLPRLCSEAIAAALCELMYGEIRHGRASQVRDLIPHVAYIALAPFMGPEAGSDFVEGKLSKA
jgi:AcrR family transcriptional regulator